MIRQVHQRVYECVARMHLVLEIYTSFLVLEMDNSLQMQSKAVKWFCADTRAGFHV